MQVKQEFNFDEFYLNVKQYLNNGIPNVHLSKGCIGELCVFKEDNGKGTALIHLWQSEFNDFLGLRNEFKRLGASRIYITHTLDDEFNFICNGICEEDDVRTITVGFSLEQNCEALRVARSKAYRAFWDMAYRIARTDFSHEKKGHDTNVLYLVRIILKATHTSVNKHAVDLGDAIKMVEQAMYIPGPLTRHLTLSELRRSELKQAADNKAEWITEYKKTLGNINITATPQQMWKTFYRGHRLGRAGCEEATSLWYSIDSVIVNNYFSNMLSCVSNIFFPRLTRSASDIHRSQFKLSHDAIEKFFNAGPDCLPSFEKKSDVYDYEDEVPF
ncbi:hypothetical protein ACU5B6_25260 [Moritella viscosa]|uniref:hypothetical protein n=2 Tax=Moritella viscosa TaxID=80854 RepID=UPI0009145C93|nr:hypothetical protein [Moritella viscosa]SHO00089.1 Putative uncharacterized protein [Moritella viscosa]SHO15254.1 Putative uncharacterized protein [Moritella viscosa]SHO18919.1 Putative uncharacterized protein [Moritella viscosa]